MTNDLNREKKNTENEIKMRDFYKSQMDDWQKNFKDAGNDNKKISDEKKKIEDQKNKLTEDKVKLESEIDNLKKELANRENELKQQKELHKFVKQNEFQNDFAVRFIDDKKQSTYQIKKASNKGVLIGPGNDVSPDQDIKDISEDKVKLGSTLLLPKDHPFVEENPLKDVVGIFLPTPTLHNHTLKQIKDENGGVAFEVGEERKIGKFGQTGDKAIKKLFGKQFVDNAFEKHESGEVFPVELEGKKYLIKQNTFFSKFDQLEKLQYLGRVAKVFGAFEREKGGGEYTILEPGEHAKGSKSWLNLFSRGSQVT